MRPRPTPLCYRLTPLSQRDKPQVEAHWKNILKANHYREDGKYDGLNTGDYFCLLAPMKLDQYEVRFNYYPWLENFLPFQLWSSPNTSKSLYWYRAYNNVKHDREGHFSEASLCHALTAVAACFVILGAQYGQDFILPEEQAAGAFFQMIKAPTWKEDEIYVPPFGVEPRPRFYEFDKNEHLIAVLNRP